MRKRRTPIGFVVIAVVIGFAAAASAAAPLPTPGTSAQVAALVTASSSIEKLPSTLVPPISEVPYDSPGAYYPAANHACDGVSKCVFGDTSSSATIVLFGDSHAQMWLPALVPVAEAARARLVLVWEPGCPAATLSVWDAPAHAINSACNRFRTSMVSRIKKIDPVLVLLSDRTSDIPGAGNRPTTSAEWRSGLEQTISELKSRSTQVAVIGDITVFSPEQLPGCLAAHPTTVQACSVSNPNGKTRQHFAAEKAASKAEKAPYLNPQDWLCTTVCSPVIGNMAVYFDASHVSSTYAEYLSGVWAAALQPLLVR